MSRSRKKSKDSHVPAFQAVKESTQEEVPDRSPISEYLAKIGRKGGLKGGPARAKKLSAKVRSEIAAKAAEVRWKKNG